MWELDHNESWAWKLWCFWTVVLEKTLESPLDGKETSQSLFDWLVNQKGNQSWIFIGRSDAEAEAPIFSPPEELTHWKRPWCWERLKVGGMGTSEDEMVSRHDWLNGHEFEKVLGVVDGHGGLVCCSPWGCKELDMTEWMKWTFPVLLRGVSFSKALSC